MRGRAKGGTLFVQPQGVVPVRADKRVDPSSLHAYAFARSRLPSSLSSASSSCSPALAVVTALLCSIASIAPREARAGGGDQVRPERQDAPTTSTHELPPSYANALRLARMINDDRTVAKLLARYGLTKNASEADIQAVVAAYETAGTPEVAVAFLRQRIGLYPTEKRPRVILAALHSRSGDTTKAVAVWKEQIDKFGIDALTLEDSHTYARDLSRTGDVDAAYTELTRLRQKAPDDAKEYWIDLATLAWERDDDATSLVAYEKVYRTDPRTLHSGARYVALLADAGRHDEAVKVALLEHRRAGDISLVLFAAHLRAERQDWKGVGEILDAAEKATSDNDLTNLRLEELFVLRAESKRNLGDLRGAAEAYRRALVVAPDSASSKANLLWTLLELNDVEQVKRLALAWSGSAKDQPLLWPPLSAAFIKLGMHQQALPYLVLQIKSDPKDGRVLLDAADALSHIGQHSLSNELRRRAVVRLRTEALKSIHAKKPTSDDLHVIESTALVVRERSGPALAESWLAAIQHANPSFTGQEELAADWYLATDRPERARKIIDGTKAAQRAPGLRKYRLALAIADENRAEAQVLLDAVGTEVPADERMHARLMLGQDGAAVSEINAEGTGIGIGVDQPDMRAEIATIASYHRPNVRVGGTYIHVTGLDTWGPIASASHDAFGGRMIYAANGISMTDRSGILVLPDTIREADAFVTYRRTTPRAVTELGVGASYQDPDGLPVARAQIFDQRLLTSRLGLTTDLRIGSQIYDSGFLRAFGARNSATVGLRYDESKWYVSGDLAVREDQSRHYKFLGWDALEIAEVGYKILTKEPGLSVGLQFEASQRDNRDDLPRHLRGSLNPRFERLRSLPPSFQLVGGVIHLSRGDYLERYRPDRAPFPRYDCELAFGALFPDTDTALHVLCGASVRAPGGYTSLLAFYNRGIAGVRNNENAELALSYTIPF